MVAIPALPAAVELFLRILNAGSVADDSETVRRLNEKKWGDDPNSLDPSLDYEIPSENVNDKGKQNFVYQPDQRIYNVENNFIFVGEPEKKTPSKPRSRLKIEDSVEVLGQTETQIVIGQPVTLQQSIESQSFGKLLFNPVENKKTKIRQIVDPEIREKIAEIEALGREQYEKWLTDYPNEEDTPSYFDPMALILPEFLRGLVGKQNLFFGSDVIRFICAYHTFQSLNVFIGVEDTIPEGFEIIEENIIFNFEKEQIEGLGLKKDGEGNDSLSEFFPTLPINWESWIKTGIAETFDNNTNQPKPAIADNLIKVFQYSLAQLYNRLGLADYPYTVPESLVLDINEEEANKTETLQNLTDLTEWIIKAFDGVLGEFPVNVEIQDNDLIQTGDQPLKFSLPNVAETLAELTGKQLLQEAELKALTTIALSSLAETGAIKQQVIQNYYLSAANQEYLGYQTSQELKDVELLFDPSFIQEESKAQTLDRIMRPSIMKVPIESNIDNDTLEAQLAIIVEACRIMKAQNWRSFGNRANIASDFVSLVKNASNLAQTLGINTDKNLDDFFEEVEQGFADKVGGNAANKPYGREYDRRPKIKKLDNNG